MAKGYEVKLRNGKRATVTVVPWLKGTEFPVSGSVKSVDELWKLNGRYREDERACAMDIVEGLPGLKARKKATGDDGWGERFGTGGAE
jgi:hypothetical protein